MIINQVSAPRASGSGAAASHINGGSLSLTHRCLGVRFAQRSLAARFPARSSAAALIGICSRVAAGKRRFGPMQTPRGRGHSRALARSRNSLARTCARICVGFCARAMAPRCISSGCQAAPSAGPPRFAVALAIRGGIPRGRRALVPVANCCGYRSRGACWTTSAVLPPLRVLLAASRLASRLASSCAAQPHCMACTTLGSGGACLRSRARHGLQGKFRQAS